MMKYIYSSSNAGTIIKNLGRYLYRHIDGAKTIKFTGTGCEVIMEMYYQLEDDPDTFNIMNFEINITTYQNKIRINITEVTPREKTIGQIIFKEDETKDMVEVKHKVLDKLKKAIEKEYESYEFVF